MALQLCTRQRDVVCCSYCVLSASGECPTMTHCLIEYQNITTTNTSSLIIKSNPKRFPRQNAIQVVRMDAHTHNPVIGEQRHERTKNKKCYGWRFHFRFGWVAFVACLCLEHVDDDTFDFASFSTLLQASSLQRITISGQGFSVNLRHQGHSLLWVFP